MGTGSYKSSWRCRFSMENDASGAKTRSGRRCSGMPRGTMAHLQITDGLFFALKVLSISSDDCTLQARRISAFNTQHLDQLAVPYPRTQPEEAFVSVAVAARRLPQPCTNCNLAAAIFSKNKPGLHMRTDACWGLNPLGCGAPHYASPFPRVPL